MGVTSSARISFVLYLSRSSICGHNSSTTFHGKHTGRLCRGSDIHTSQSKTNQISLTVTIHIADRADKLANRPAMRQVKGAGPFADGAEAAAIREGDVDPIQSKADQVSPAVVIHVTDRTDKILHGPAM